MRYALLLASIFLALAGFAVPAQAYTLTSREHRFSIELPGEPDYHGPRTIFLGDNEYDRARLGLRALLGPSVQADAEDGRRALSQRSSSTRRGDARVVESDKPIRQGGVTGRDALIRDTKWTHRHGCGFRRFSLRVRGFVVRNRLYWVQYKTFIERMTRWTRR